MSAARAFAWVLLTVVTVGIGWIIWQALVDEANAAMGDVRDNPPSGDTND